MEDSMIMMATGFVASVIGIGGLGWKIAGRRGEEKQKKITEAKKEKERDLQRDAAFALLEKNEKIHDYPDEHGIGTNLISSTIEKLVINMEKSSKDQTQRIETALNRMSVELKVTNDHSISFAKQHETLLNHLISKSE